MTKTLVFEMAMTCEGCANAARRVLGKLGEEKVKVLDVDVATKKVTVASEIPAAEIQAALEKTGKAIKLISEQ
ncbi:unnamed protein product, partial [Mesorhabditis spiculigera]